MYCSAISAGFTRYLWRRAANENRSGGERNPIGRRTESDWVADGNRQGVQLSQLHQQSSQGYLQRGCTCLKCTNRASREYSHRIRRTHRTVWQRKPPTDRHRCAQIRRVWHPAIPTQPTTQPNHLCKSVKSVGEYYHAGAAVSAAPTKQTERVSHRIRRTHRTVWQRKPPTDRHRCAQIRRVWHPAIPTPPITQPNHL